MEITIVKNKKRVLFITEKWCDGNPQMGLTNHYHNLFGTLESLDIVDIGIFHYDEFTRETGKHVDAIIPEVINQFNPHVVVASHLGTSPLNPTIKSYQYIKSAGKKTVFIWPDTRGGIIDTIKELEPLVALSVSWAFENEKMITPNHIWLATPQDPKLYSYDVDKKYEASFIGSLTGYAHRGPYLQHALKLGCPITISGGQREHALSPQEYAEMIKKSKISINFAEAAIKGTSQLKGRVTETLACGTLLLEHKNPVTSRLLQPGIHYVEFDDENDLAEKINYYLKNDEERKKIAKAGFEFYNKKFSPLAFWNTILTRIGENDV